MTTLQEAAQYRSLYEVTGDIKDLNTMLVPRTALAQHRERHPVCHGCGIPAGDVHMKTCKSGKWPSRVSNGDTAAPAPQPASEPVANFIVSAVVVKNTSVGFNTQNKLYPVSAANSDEATGKALPLVTNDFPEHRLHTMCFIQTAPAPQAQEPAKCNHCGGTGELEQFTSAGAPTTKMVCLFCKGDKSFPVFKDKNPELAWIEQCKRDEEPAPQPVHQGERAELIRQLYAIANTEANEVADALNEAADMLQSAQPVGINGMVEAATRPAIDAASKQGGQLE